MRTAAAQDRVRLRAAALVIAGFAALLLAACSESAVETAAYGGAAPEAAVAAADAFGQAPADAFLAYEHDATVTLAADRIPARLQQVQSACTAGTHGQCEVLAVRQQGGDWPSASLRIRIEPAGVEPMIALASADAQLGSRSTRAEDLAVVVRDNTLAQERLRNERERLQEFQSRRDLSVGDMIALSRQLAEVEAQLEAAMREGAQHRRRIDTHLLGLEFHPSASQASRSEVWQALRDSGATLSAGLAWTIRAVVFLLPALLVVWTLAALVRRWRRRRALRAASL